MRRPRLAHVLAITALVIVVVVGALVVWAAGDGDAIRHDRMPDDASPRGAMAVAEVLRAQGVEVIETSTLDATLDALAGAADETTLLIDDDWWFLGPEAYEVVAASAADIVLITPPTDALGVLAPGVVPAQWTFGEFPPACDLPAAQRAGALDTDAEQYEVPSGAVGCYPSDDGETVALAVVERGRGTTTVVGMPSLFRNDEVATGGNAALVLGLLGEHPRLIWYQPGLDDIGWAEGGTLADFQADWFAPLVVLALLVGIAAAVWRGRRMGPVVVEDLPVEVRASETMEGRARLYERAGARDHALDMLRQATIARLALTIGLPRTAGLDEIVDACAALTGRDPAEVHGLLRSRSAADDAALVQLSDGLLRLERDLAHTLEPR